MSYSTSIGHAFTDLVRHRSRMQHARHWSTTTAGDTPHHEPSPMRPWADIDGPVEADRQDLEQWSAAFGLAMGLNR